MRRDWPDWAQEFGWPWDQTFLHTALWQWIGLAVILVSAVLAGFLGRAIVIQLIRLRSRVFPERLTKVTEKAMRRAGGLLTGVGVCYPMLDEIALPPGLDHFWRMVLEGATIVAIATLAYALWDAVSDEIAARATGSQRAEKLLVPMARKFVRAIIVVVAVLVAATLLFGADVRGIMASLGIGGLVVALASKDSVENLFGSLTILFDMPFAIGDWVKIDKTEGIVEEINLRSTRIRTFEDTVITLPNANLIRASVENYSARRSRRQRLSVRVSYDTKPDALDAFCAELRSWISEQAKVAPGKTLVDISELDEPSLGVLVQCHFQISTQAEELEMRHALALQILRLRDKHDVSFAAHPRPLDPEPQGTTVPVPKPPTGHKTG
jgi:MscS family membrane protein